MLVRFAIISVRNLLLSIFSYVQLFKIVPKINNFSNNSFRKRIEILMFRTLMIANPDQRGCKSRPAGKRGRTKKGIPAVDTSVYTNENAAYAESLLILWAASGKQTYFDKAIKCIDFLMRERKQKNAYKHVARYTSTISLNDNLAMLKTLMLAYRATQQEVYKTEAAQLVKEINTLFNSHTGYFYAYTENSAIKATYNITENIEACRLLNYSSYFFHEPEFKKRGKNCFPS